jgi:hypothetical protein
MLSFSHLRDYVATSTCTLSQGESSDETLGYDEVAPPLYFLVFGNCLRCQ